MFDLATLRLIWEPRMLSILRFVVGVLFLEHGLAKAFNFPARPNHLPFHLFSLVPGVAGILEMIGGVLIAVGLFTRPVAFVLAGEMAVAYFTSHSPRSFFPLLNGGEGAILYCFTFLYLFVGGGGIWSLDQLWAWGGRAPGAGPVELTRGPPG